MKQLSLGSLYHQPWAEYRCALPDGRVCVRLRAGRGDFDRVTLRAACTYTIENPFGSAQEFEMERAFRDDLYDFWQAVFTPADRRFKYLFVLRSGEQVLKLDAAGLRLGADGFDDISEAFAFAYAYPTDPMPEWARGCVGYQIFPDRFRREGEPEAGLEPWTSNRVQNEFRFGGNLRGMRAAVPYLRDLGVKLVYTTPLFLSNSSHRYNTFDYYQVDPLLGTKEELKELCDELHRNGMRLVLDGVFNHSGTQFPPFVDALQKREQSEYYDWFFFDNTEACGYQTFGHTSEMPKLNLRNEGCARYFLDVGRYWLEELGMDGWRLDVSPEVWPDFWRQYRKMMKQVNPDSLMIAECWDDSREWLANGDMFDSTMHYVLSRNIWNRFCKHSISAEAFDCALNDAAVLYPTRNQDVLWTFLGSHDTERLRTRAGGDLRMLYGASFFQFTFPGAPIIYYGDELGMEGGADPYNRAAMHWDDVDNNPTHRHYRKLACLRAEHEALRIGEFRSFLTTPDGLLAYRRFTPGEHIFCVLNTSTEPIACHIPLPEELAGMAVAHDLYAEVDYPIVCGQLQVKLNPGEGYILK